MSKTREAFDARNKIVAELRSLDAEIGAAEASAEQAAKLATLEGELRSADEAMEAAIDADAKEARYLEAYNAIPRPAAEVEARHDQMAEDRKALKAFVDGEVRSVEFRAALDTDPSRGGDTVPTGMYSVIYDAFVEYSTVVQAGATVINTAGGAPLTMPFVNSRPAASLVAEGATIGKSDGTYDAFELGAYKFAFISQATRELLTDSAFNMASEVGKQGGRAIGLGTGSYFVTGTGSSQPEGVVTGGTNVADHFASASAITADELIGLQHEIIAPYRNNAVWLVNDSTLAAIRQLKDSNNAYIWQPGIQAGQPDTLLGRPVYSDPAMPAIGSDANSVVFGDLQNGFVIRQAMGIEIVRSDEYAFDTDLVSWRFVTRFDSKVRDAAAIAVGNHAA